MNDVFSIMSKRATLSFSRKC